MQGKRGSPVQNHIEVEEKGFAVFCFPYLLAATLFIVIVSTVAWANFLADLDAEERAIENNALRTVASVADAYAEHLYRMLEGIDQLTMHVRHGWQSGKGSYRLEEATRAGILPTRSGFDATILDRDGNLVTTTIPRAANINASREPFFLVHVGDPGDFLYIGPPREGIYKKMPVMQFSRKLIRQDGTWEGIVLVSVIPEYFIASFGAGVLGERGLLAMLGGDLITRTSRVGTTTSPADSPAILQRLPVHTDTGAQLLTGPGLFADQRSRYAAWRTTDNYSMVVLAGLDQEDVLAAYRKSRSIAVQKGLLTTAAAIFLVLLTSAVIARLAWRKNQLDALQLTYRTATERGADGFLIARPLVSESGNIIDFLVVDCNQNAGNLFGMNREQFIGQTVRSIYSGSTLTRTLELLRKATESRLYEGELEIGTHDREGRRWVHLTVSRPDSDLAVTLRDITQQKLHLQELERIGSEDALTGLPNRHWLKQNLPDVLATAQKDGHKVSLLFIDLDGFKAVNDTMGHEVGDELLRTVGKRLIDAVRPEDNIVRIGGDEFVVVIKNIQTRLDAAHVAERVLSAFKQPFRLKNGMHSVGTSIGISMYPGDGDDVDALLKNADMAMYAVKTEGKHSFKFFDADFANNVQAKHHLESEFRAALEHNQIVVFYQPRISLASGKTSSMEALARWAHPVHGLIEPSMFIPLAEETGLVVRLGEVVLEKVCEQLGLWIACGGDVVPVSINVSARHFGQADVVSMTTEALHRLGIPGELLEIEITESTMMDNIDAVREAQKRLQDLGVRLLVDDFGTGYSSLSQLQELDFDVLKVDRAFTHRLAEKGPALKLFTAIVSMAHSLDMRVVAEGVETAEQARQLREMRCDEAQGFFISPPVPPSSPQPFASTIFRL